jgi:signal transduction histidine kinase/ligand-binding sensor domain-containing protein
MFRHAASFLLTLLGCGLVLPSLAAESPTASSYIVDALGVAPGSSQRKLPSQAVISVIQTRDGYLWLGTFKGLVRFDGVHFEVFNQSNTPGLGNDLIVHLFEDSRGWLWVGTADGGVTLVREGRVDDLPIQRSTGRLMSACEDADKSVWLYFSDGQLWRYADGELARAAQVDEFPSFSRTVIAERDGPVWVGADSGQKGMGIHAPSNTVAPQVLAGKLDLLLASQSGGYWRLADNRIEKWRGTQRERTLGFYPWTNAPNVRVTSACEDRTGNLVVGVLNDGVYWFNTEGKATHISPVNGLSHAGVLSVCVDREGNLWAGTDGGGLNRIKPRIGTVASGAETVVQSATEDGEGTLWAGFTSRGILRSSGGEQRVFGWENGFQPDDGLISPNVLTMFSDASNQVWATTRAPGALHRFENGKFTPVRETIGQEIQAIYQDRRGQFWLGTSGGLILWDGQTWSVLTMQDGLSANGVLAVTQDAAGNVWIGTAGGGLNQLRDGKLSVFRKQPNGLPGDYVTSLLVDADDVLWVGTGSGLARLRQGHWTSFTTRDGLVSDSISYLLDDGDGSLWVGSNLGLMRMSKQSLNDFAEGRTHSIVCRAFDQADGLPAGECTSGSQPAALKSHSGRLWFPTIGGLVGIDPSKLQPNTNPPPVVIETVLVDGESQLTNGIRGRLPAEIIVPAQAERLEFHFASLNLAAPERALFRHQMEGHESSLSDPRETRMASYSKLPPGEYRFHVIAANEDGLWNEIGSTLAVRVLPPFWRQAWFLTVSGLALLGGVVGIVYWFATQKLQRQLAILRQKEALERERARIARDLHDQLGANLTRVSLLGELVETDKDEPAEVEAHARQISRTAAETAHALDEIVWAANPSNDTLEGLVNYLCKYAQDFLNTANVRCRLDVPAHVEQRPIPPDARHTIFLVAKEALNNVAKHAQASSVHLHIEVNAKHFTVEIIDDGRGPSGAATAEKRGRNGLRNMRRRMEDAGGSFVIEPAKPKGTRVRLTAPLEKK